MQCMTETRINSRSFSHTPGSTVAFSTRMPVSSAVEPQPPVRPFLKWAGGKRQLLRDLRRFVPPAIGAYHEPFLGSGALFFDLWKTGALRGVPCHLGDANADLIGVYRALAAETKVVIAELRKLSVLHANGGADAYYKVRDQLFNPQRRARLGRPAGEVYSPRLAAMFIYLNRTGYNGLFRLNASGDFNVPAGRYANPRICDEDKLRSAAAVLGAEGVTLRVQSFTEVEPAARPGDLVYFDPPYAPLSATARFTAYTALSFSDEDQRTLQALVIRLARRGCAVIVSNSTAPVVQDLYESDEARAAGLVAYRVPARRAINSKAARRGAVDEFVISNVPPTRQSR
jgi:DNA adenine methylase